MQVEIHKVDGLTVLGKASFLCAYFQDGELPVVLAEDEIVAPEQRWELRASGLWADMICERPLNHWSYGLEAFGLAIDEPEELLGRGYGDRVPLGWELDFESSSERVEGLFDSAGQGETGGYRQSGLGDGLVLLADRSVPLSGPALRHHWWGPPAAMDFERVDVRLSSGSQPGAADTRSAAALPMPGAVWKLVHEQGSLTSATST